MGTCDSPSDWWLRLGELLRPGLASLPVTVVVPGGLDEAKWLEVPALEVGHARRARGDRERYPGVAGPELARAKLPGLLAVGAVLDRQLPADDDHQLRVVHVPLGHGEVRADAPSLPSEGRLDVGRPPDRAVQRGGDVDRRIRDES